MTFNFPRPRALLALPLAIAAAFGATTKPAEAGANPYLGEVILFAGNFCPRSYAAAEGQLLPIASNTALFSLLGTTYGGDGRTTFALPDLRGRYAKGDGVGPPLLPYTLGMRGGTETHTLTTSEMPSHNHLVNVTNAEADKGGPGDDYLAAGGGEHYQCHEGPPNRTMEHDVISNTGGNLPHNIQDPFLVMRYCIALQGTFPSRS